MRYYFLFFRLHRKQFWLAMIGHDRHGWKAMVCFHQGEKRIDYLNEFCFFLARFYCYYPWAVNERLMRELFISLLNNTRPRGTIKNDQSQVSLIIQDVEKIYNNKRFEQSNNPIPSIGIGNLSFTTRRWRRRGIIAFL